jgi:type IV secretion system protein VirB4
MNLASTLKALREETAVSTMFPITHLNTPSIFESKQGYLGATLKVQGIPFLTTEISYLNHMGHQLHQAMRNLDEQCIQYVTLHRRKEKIGLSGEFKSAFARDVNDKYHARFKGKSLFKNDIYLTTVLKGDTSSKAARSLSFLKKLNQSYLNAKEAHREANILALMAKVDQLKASLSAFQPHLLGEKDEELGFSELLTFLSLIPNAGEPILFKKHHFYPPIAQDFSKTLLADCLYPNGHLGQYLCNQQIFFGTCIQFQGADNDSRFGAMLSIKQYGQQTAHVMLDPLLELDSEFILTHSFAPIPRDVALKLVSKKRDKLINAKDLGASQIADLSLLEDEIASEEIRLGYHHNSLLLIACSKDELEKAVREAIKAYAYSGIVLIKENLGAEPAFWAQIPTNHHLITRAALITSLNFVDFCSLHNLETGFRGENHLKEAVTLLETPSKTPVYFNYHTKSSPTNPAKGHTAIYGATNAGKNTLVAFLDAQMGRFNNRSFFLERDEASKIYVLASGNSSYTVIAPEHAHKMRMNPLQLEDSPKNRTFIRDWFAQLIKTARRRVTEFHCRNH